jgi:hypothetical protein
MSTDSIDVEAPSIFASKKKLLISIVLTVMAVLILGSAAYFILRKPTEESGSVEA